MKRARRKERTVILLTLATPRATASPPGAAPAATSFPTPSTQEIADPESPPPPPLPPTNSSLSNRPHGQIEDHIFCRRCRHGCLPPASSFLSTSPRGPHRRQAVGGRRGRGRVPSRAPLRPQLTHLSTAKAPTRRDCPQSTELQSRAERARPPPAASRNPGGQTHTRHLGAEGLHNTLTGAQGTDPLVPGAHPSLAGCVVDNGNSSDPVTATPWGRASYKDVLLRSVQEETEVGWQVVGSGRARCVANLRQRVPQLQVNIKEDSSPRRRAYLQRMKGKCFNCLAHGHFVAQCQDSTRCWFCQCSGHISTSCPKRKKMQHRDSGSAITNSFSATWEKQRQQNGHSLGDPPTVTNKTGDVVSIVDDSLLHLVHPPLLTACEKLFDPMVFEALITSQMHKTGSGAMSLSLLVFPNGEEGRYGQPGELCKSPPPILPSPMSILHISQSLNDCQSALIIRSEAEQLTGHELIHALGSLKHGEKVPLSPSTMEHKSSNEVATVVSLEDNQCCNQKSKFKIESPYPRQSNSCVKEPTVGHSGDIQNFSHNRKTKIKSRKPAIKVVRDMLTIKWIVVKRQKLSIVGKNGKLNEEKLRECADRLKDLLPPNLLMALLSLKSRDFWDIVVALSP